MLVGADIDQLHATIAAFRRGSAELNGAFQRALQAMQAMQNSPWSGRHRQQVEAAWERIQVQFTPTLNALEDLTARTERFTEALEEAGRAFGDGGSISTGPNGSRPSYPDSQSPKYPFLDWSRFRKIWWAEIIAELIKAGMLAILAPGAIEVLAVTAAALIGGTIFNASAASLGYWIAGPEYDARIAENARAMEESLRRMNLLNPINQAVAALAQGKDGIEVLNVFWESTVDIGRGGYDYIRAGGDQLGIIASEGRKHINQTISEMGKIARTGLEQASRQAQQIFNDTLQWYRPLFSR